MRVEIDDVTLPKPSFAEQEADRAGRADDRADRYNTYASNAQARSESAYQRYRQAAENWPLG